MTQSLRERVDEHGIYVVNYYGGTTREADGRKHHEWISVLCFPADTDAPDLYLPSPIEDRDEGEIIGLSNYTGRTMIVQNQGSSAAYQDNEQPDVYELVQTVCHQTVDIINAQGNYNDWVSNWFGDLGQITAAELARAYDLFTIHTAQTIRVRQFLGEHFDEFLWKTEWDA
jgi:hypothetical protein